MPVVNRTDRAVRFGAPSCGCACRAAAWTNDAVEPGGRTELVVVTAGGSVAEAARFVCRWTDDTGQEWTARYRAEFLPEEAFDGRPGPHFGLRPGATFGDRVRYVQYAPPGAELPPATAFSVTDSRLRIADRSEQVEALGEGWSRRTTTLELAGRADLDPGHFAAHVRVDRAAAGVTVEWQVRSVLECSPTNLVLTRRDFGDSPTVRRSFALRGTGETVRVTAVAVVGLPDGLLTATPRTGGAVSVIDVEVRWAGAETRNGSVVLTTDLAECPRLTIPIALIADPRTDP